MKYILCLVMIALSACSGSGSSSSVNTPPITSGSVNESLKVLASNVVMGTAQAADGVDTTTKVLASNVTLDSKGLSIAATNVQDAFGETEPDPAISLVGTWKGTIVTTGMQTDTTDRSMTLTFNNDGTYTCIEAGADSLTAADAGLDKYGPCSATSSTWSLLGKRVLKLSFSYVTTAGSPVFSVYRTYSVLYLDATHLEFTANGRTVAILVKQ